MYHIMNYDIYFEACTFTPPQLSWKTQGISRLFESFESTKATGPDKIPVFVLKNLSLEILIILAK